MITRRHFMTFATGAAVVWTVPAWPQQAERVRRVGVLIPFAENDAAAQARLKAFEQAFNKLGWIEGRNVRFDRRWAGGDPERIRSLANELVELRPDAILAHSTPAVAALQQRTLTIPIVFANLSDPVGSGFVESLSRPGGNATGFINLEASLGSKWVELLREVVPGIKRAALLFNPETAPFADYYVGPFGKAAELLGMQALTIPVHDTAKIESSIASLGRESNSGLVVMPDTFVNVHRKLIISLAARHRVPTVFPYGYMAVDGGLLSYGVEQTNMYIRAAVYIDRILKGAKPADLPVEQPTKFELFVNLRTAKALGIKIPQSILVRADRVIE